MKSQRNNGFTLIELLTTVAIIGILGMVAIPGMTTFIKNERLTTQINSILSHLQYARSEAILRHKQIVVCASSDYASCSGTWSDGWIVFHDDDASGSVSGDEQVLKAHAKLEGENTLSSTGGLIVIYDRRGFSPTSASTFSACDSRGASEGKSISISNTGRIRNGGTVSC